MSTLERLAHHEAGHALVAHLLVDRPRRIGVLVGTNFANRGLERNLDQLRRPERGHVAPRHDYIRADHNAAIYAAGVAAELRLADQEPGPVEEPNEKEHADWAIARKIIRSCVPDDAPGEAFHRRMAAYRLASRLLREHWAIVQELAHHLMQVQERDGEAVRHWLATRLTSPVIANPSPITSDPPSAPSPLQVRCGPWISPLAASLGVYRSPAGQH